MRFLECRVYVANISQSSWKPPAFILPDHLLEIIDFPIHQGLVPLPRFLLLFSPLHRFTASPLYRFTALPLHRFTASPLHRSTALPLHRFTVFPFPRFTLMERW